MKRPTIRGQRLAAVFLLGCILLNYPVLFLFDRPLDVFGVPLLYCYILGAWILLIGLIAVIAESSGN